MRLAFRISRSRVAYKVYFVATLRELINRQSGVWIINITTTIVMMRRVEHEFAAFSAVVFVMAGANVTAAGAKPA